MEIVVEMSGKTPREYGGRVKWGVHPKGFPKDYWVDIYVQDRPKPGQVFNIGAIKETPSADGVKIFREAEIIGPAGFDPVKMQLPPMKGTSGASNGKIKWDDWVQIARAASELAWKLEPEPATSPNDHAPAARLAFVNTTLIAYSNGKLELPTDAGPVSREPGSDDAFSKSQHFDDGAYDDPDAVIPWGKQG